MKYHYSYFYKVENKSAYRTASPYYWLAKTEDNQAYLFTESDLEKAAVRGLSNPEDVPKTFFSHKKGDRYASFSLGAFFGGFIVGFLWLLFP